MAVRESVTLPAGRAPTLAAAVAPHAVSTQAWAWLRPLALMLGFSALVALSAQIAVLLPFTPVPVTAQTLAVLLTGAALGWRLGTGALLMYAAEGLLGLPVFAGGASAWSPVVPFGVPWIVGPTAGYVLGFIVAAALLGFLAELGWDRSVPLMALAMVLGSAVIYAFGLLELVRYVPWPATLGAGMLPFLPGDAVKAVLAALALPGAWSLLGRRTPRPPATIA